MVGGVLGGSAADLLGLRETFFVLAITPLLGALLMVRGVAASEMLVEERGPRRAPWRAVLRLPVAVWVGVLVMFFINGLNALTNTFHPVLAVAAGLSVTQVGALSSIRSWASSSSRFGSGPLFSRFDPAGRIGTMFRVVPAVLLVLYLTLALPAQRALTPETARR